MTFQLTEAIESIQLGDTEKFRECLNEHIEQVYKQKLNEEISPYEDTKIITEITMQILKTSIPITAVIPALQVKTAIHTTVMK